MNCGIDYCLIYVNKQNYECDFNTDYKSYELNEFIIKCKNNINCKLNWIIYENGYFMLKGKKTPDLEYKIIKLKFSDELLKQLKDNICWNSDSDDSDYSDNEKNY